MLDRFGRRFSVALALAVLSLNAHAQATTQQYIDYTNGFTNTSGLKLNGSASMQGSGIQLTDGKQFEAGSFFYSSRVPVRQFMTEFDFQLTDASADGFAFVLQALGPNVLGSAGGGVGYGNIPGGAGPIIGGKPVITTPDGLQLPHTDSTAVVFDLHDNQGEGSNSVRLEANGVTDNSGAPHDLTPFGINLHSGHPFHVEISGPTNIMVGITDLQTNATASIPFGFPATQTGGGPYGYAGFTGGTGAGTAVQTIKNWAYYAADTANEPGLQNEPNFQGGFSNTAPTLNFNGGAAVSGSALQLTHGTSFEASSVFQILQVPSTQFVTDFDFNMADGEGDGFAFVLQHQHIASVGGSGGGLGYGLDKPGAAGPSIGDSLAVKFDLHNNAGEGNNSTGVYVNGASPTVPAVDLTSSGINLHSGHTFHAHISSGPIGDVGPTLTVTIVDLDRYKVFQQSFSNYSLPNFDFVGFTSGTGTTPSTIKILNWTYQSVPVNRN